VKLDTYRGEVVPYYTAENPLYSDVAQAQGSAGLGSRSSSPAADLEKTRKPGRSFTSNWRRPMKKRGNIATRSTGTTKRCVAGRSFVRDGRPRGCTDRFRRSESGGGSAGEGGGIECCRQRGTDRPWERVPQTGKFDAAQQNLTRALNVNPDNPEAQNLLGLALANSRTPREPSVRSVQRYQYSRSLPRHIRIWPTCWRRTAIMRRPAITSKKRLPAIRQTRTHAIAMAYYWRSAVRMTRR